ncbi:hypothetical protein AVEN_182830-1 [Araneus ventricosus]|uniref:Uncharacterized protein n=1 Tax=Araneus ventricosus TaxID=182803 RepID=A0A4Y2NKB7_ARAVE|nr:hypothetical protein AVEN_182830-1 [Araneus ventricosus]
MQEVASRCPPGRPFFKISTILRNGRETELQIVVEVQKVAVLYPPQSILRISTILRNGPETEPQVVVVVQKKWLPGVRPGPILTISTILRNGPGTEPQVVVAVQEVASRCPPG